MWLARGNKGWIAADGPGAITRRLFCVTRAEPDHHGLVEGLADLTREQTLERTT